VSSGGQETGVSVTANDTASLTRDKAMSVAAKRDDVFAQPVLIGVRGWSLKPLKQIRTGYRAVRAACLDPRPANER
jgi:hypothetical protein